MNESQASKEQIIWCPYLGSHVCLTSSNDEHIIPLSLGGSNGFTIPVDRTTNSRLGTQVDAGLSDKDFFTLQRRREYDARGHHKRPPIVRVRNASYGDPPGAGEERQPVQVTLHGERGITVWDARSGTNVPPAALEGKHIHMEFKLNVYARMKFVAKVALAAGYAIYGELFRETADHHALRALMNASDQATAVAVMQTSGLRGVFQFLPVDAHSEQITNLVMLALSTIPGSVVFTGTSESSVIFHVSLLGQWIGAINVPANTADYPLCGLHDQGHAVLMVNKQTERVSGRMLMSRCYEALSGMKAPPAPPKKPDAQA